MKTITIHIPDDIYQELMNNLGVRRLSGSMHGLLDSFTLRLFSLIEEGKAEHTFKRKKSD